MKGTFINEVKQFFFNVGPPKEDIFSGHLLCPIFQSTFTHYNYKFMPWCVKLSKFWHIHCLSNSNAIKIQLKNIYHRRVSVKWNSTKTRPSLPVVPNSNPAPAEPGVFKLHDTAAMCWFPPMFREPSLHNQVVKIAHP